MSPGPGPFVPPTEMLGDGLFWVVLGAGAFLVLWVDRKKTRSS